MSFLERKNTKDGMAAGQKASVDNIYSLDGKVPVLNAIPFGLQHILAMFVANIAPILIVAGACGMDAKNTAMIVQSAMMIAGIGTLIQLFPIWRIGSRLPIVMGISFTFVSIACVIGGQYGYGAIMGAVLVGGIVEGILGLLSKYWMKLVTPIVAATVVTAIGFSLLEVGADSFGGGSSSADFGSATNWILGTVTLVCCIVFNIVAKSYFKQLSVLFGLIVGYIVALCMGVVDFSALSDTSLLALPHLMPFKMEFHADAIVAFVLIFLVSATETIGDTSALASSGLNRDVTQKEIAGSLACDGFVSALSSVFGCMPITSFSQNVGLGCHDQGCKPFCHCNGGHNYDSGRNFPGSRCSTCHTAKCSSGRMYNYDVRNYCNQWTADDWKMWIFPEKYYHIGTVLKYRIRLYPAAGFICNLPRHYPFYLCRKLCSSCIPYCHYFESCIA